jgi:hypothetical protein
MIYKHGRFEMSGPVRHVGGPFTLGPDLTFTVESDFRVVNNWLGWPVPDAPISGGQTVEYRTITGPAETVVKTVMAENAARLGYPLTVAEDEGRGAVGTYSFRFHPIYDRLFPAVDQAGIGVTVRMEGQGLLLDCYEPRDYEHRLSPDDGTVVGGTFSLTAPSTTRVVVGGQGEGVLREFRAFSDHARDTAEGDIYQARADEALAAGAAMAGLSLELSETKHFRYGGEGLRVGDRVTAEIDGQLFTDVLREVRLSWDKTGDVATPVLGERSDDTDTRLAKKLRALERGDTDRMAR